MLWKRKKDETEQQLKAARLTHPFWIIVQKEMADQIRSWRFLILLAIILLTCVGSLYAAMMHLRDAIEAQEVERAFVFLKLFTVTDGTLPSYITFISFLGPLLGIGLGFDAINSERNKGTLSRIMSQPIHRDSLLNAKFVSSLFIIGVLFFALAFLVMGMGILATGLPPTPDEFIRILLFMLVSVIYVGFWLNLSILFSVRFRQPATSALSGIAVWLFFSVFFNMLVQLLARAIAPGQQASVNELISYQELVQWLMRISPSNLFSDATSTLLMPTIRTLGPMTQEQLFGAIPSPLSVGQSMLLVWPQLTGIIAATLICFGISYVLFMRQEIRSR